MTNTANYINHKRYGLAGSTDSVTNIWTTLNVGARDDIATTRHKGQIAELILFAYYMNEQQRCGVELYLKKKYALQSAF